MFMQKYRPGAPYFWSNENPPTEEQAELFRLWMRHVFMPLNVRMVDVVTNKADLLEEPFVPECLLELCAHVASYQPVLKRWEDDDFSENTAVVNFPGLEIIAYADRKFQRLKAEQNELLGVEVSA